MPANVSPLLAPALVLPKPRPFWESFPGFLPPLEATTAEERPAGLDQDHPVMDGSVGASRLFEATFSVPLDKVFLEFRRLSYLCPPAPPSGPTYASVAARSLNGGPKKVKEVAPKQPEFSYWSKRYF